MIYNSLRRKRNICRDARAEQSLEADFSEYRVDLLPERFDGSKTLGSKKQTFISRRWAHALMQEMETIFRDSLPTITTNAPCLRLEVKSQFNHSLDRRGLVLRVLE
jgi:hypothetical protein